MSFAPPVLGYRPALDGIRAIAILVVVVEHAYGWPVGGFLGVDLFFVLSGFLITGLLVQERLRTDAISLRAFYRRRILRLWPALFTLIAAYVAIALGSAASGLDVESLDVGDSLRGAFFGMFFLSNVVLATGAPLPLPQLWSLAAEEQFYVLWSVVLVVVLHRVARLRLLEVLIVAGIAAVVAHRIQLESSGASFVRLYYSPDVRFDALLVGCLLGLWYAAGRLPRVLRDPRVLRVAAPLALAAFLAAVLAVDNHDRALYSVWLLPIELVSGVLIVSAAVHDRGLVARWLAHPVPVALGKMSYSLYLWHVMVLSLGEKLGGVPPVIGIAVSVGVAALSYRFVELPFLRLKHRRRAGHRELVRERTE